MCSYTNNIKLKYIISRYWAIILNEKITNTPTEKHSRWRKNWQLECFVTRCDDKNIFSSTWLCSGIQYGFQEVHCVFIYSFVNWKFLFAWKGDGVSQQQKAIKLVWMIEYSLALAKHDMLFSHLTSVLPSNCDYFYIFACVNELDRCKYFITGYIKHVCALIQHTVSDATSNNTKT